MVMPVVELISQARDLGNILQQRRRRAKEIAEKQELSARRLQAQQVNKVKRPPRTTMVRDEIQKWHQQEMNEFLKMEKSQFKALEEESKMEFEFPTDNTWLAKELNRPTQRSTMFNPEEW